MKLRQYMTILLRRWWLIAASVIGSEHFQYMGTRVIPRPYQSHTTLIVAQILPNLNPSSSQLFTF